MLDKLGEFKLIELLGEGGMGAVYRARQESLARDVAVKILPERLTSNPKFVQRFYREARSAAGLVHPNVVQIYSLGQDEDRGVHYYAMEYVRGKDLSQLLKSGVRFSVDQALTMVMQVAEALAAAAEAGIVHRDIKPANIMLTAKGQVKVMDFGLAKMVQHDDLDVTEAGTIVGTANYMSPEQGMGKELDFRTDIYSLGVVFYELVAGRTPFKADGPSAVIYLHVYEEPKRPSQYNPKIPPAVDRLILRMMAKLPKDRFASPDQLLSELRRLKQELVEKLGRVAPPRRSPSGRILPTGPVPAGASPVPPAAPRRTPSGRLAPVVPDAPSASAAAQHEAAPRPPSSRSPAPVPASQAPGGGQPRAGAVPQPGSRTGSVLICDSSEYNRRMYRTALQGGFSLATVSSGRECLDILAEGGPDVLVLDLGLRDTGGFPVLDRIRQERAPTEVVAITGEGGREFLERLERYQPAAVLIKPVKLNDLRLRVSEVLARQRDRQRSAPREPSAAFMARVSREEIVEMARLSLAGLARRLLERQRPAEAELLARRINSGSPNEVVRIIHEMFARFDENDALSLAIFAFKEGDHRVRILAADLVGRRFPPKRAGELLSRFVADADYRVRISAIRELARIAAPGAAGLLERFLADESWKVRREAARGLEQLAGGGVSAALISYYARNNIPPPLYLQRAVKAPNPAETIAALEAACSSGPGRVKEYIAGLMGQASSKLVVPSLLKLLGDEQPAVRTAAARALAGFPTEKVKAQLFQALTDDRFGVLKAVAETLGSFSLQREALALVKLLSATGKRVPKAAADFAAWCDAAPGNFELALLDLQVRDEATRGVIALILKLLYESDAAVGQLVVRLCSADRSQAAAAAREAAERLIKFLTS